MSPFIAYVWFYTSILYVVSTEGNTHFIKVRLSINEYMGTKGVKYTNVVLSRITRH